MGFWTTVLAVALGIICVPLVVVLGAIAVAVAVWLVWLVLWLIGYGIEALIQACSPRKGK